MREVLQRIRDNRWWFLGSLIFVSLIILFFWKLINPTGYEHHVNGFLQDVWEMIKFVMYLLGFYLFFAGFFHWPPFRKKKSGGH